MGEDEEGSDEQMDVEDVVDHAGARLRATSTASSSVIAAPRRASAS
jgi:hypothetical protein